MPPKINLVGQRFERLLVLEEAGQNAGRNYLWRCQCDCGNEVIVAGGQLRYRHTQSCGCLQIERAKAYRRTPKAIAQFAAASAKTIKHGLTKTPEHRAWALMRQRCSNANNKKDWPFYGGRTPPVTVCEHWLNSFLQFLADMGTRPSPQHSIDKDHGPGQYWCPRCGGDVRWATPKEQANNRRKQVLVLKLCSAENCMKQAQARGLCNTHYMQEWRKIG